MNAIERLENEKFELNTDQNDIKAPVRNALKKQLTNDIADFLKNYFENNDNIDVEVTLDGVAVSIYNAELDNCLTFVVDTTFKKFDYNIDDEADNYQFEQEEKARKKLVAEQKKQAKIKKDQLKREQKALERQLAAKIANGQVSPDKVKRILE